MEVWQEEKPVYMVSQEVLDDYGFCRVYFVKKFDSEADAALFSLLDHSGLRADDMPDFITATDETQPCTHNPSGVKGCGESGTIGAPAAITARPLGRRVFLILKSGIALSACAWRLA